MKFASTLKEATHRLLGIPYGIDHYEGSAKDTPDQLFFDHTPREWYIAMSETLLKPMAGTDAFGRIQARLIQVETVYNTFVFSDSGFYDETIPIIKKVGPENCLYIELSRPGTSFDGDSRGNIYDALAASSIARGMKLQKINNDEDLDFLRMMIKGTVKGWLGLEE